MTGWRAGPIVWYGSDMGTRSTITIYTRPPGEVDAAAVAADEATPRQWARLRPRQIEGGIWVYPVRYARPEVTVYTEDGRDVRDLVTEAVLSDPEWLDAVPGTAALLGGGEQHWQVVDVTQPTDRAQVVGQCLSSWWCPHERAHVGEISVMDPAANRAIQSGEIREVSIAYRVERRPATDAEREAHGCDRVQTRRWSPRNLAILREGRASTTIVADQTGRRPIGVRMDPKIAALLVEHGLDQIEQREALIPLAREVVRLRADAAQVAADAKDAEAAADAAPTGPDWEALISLRQSMQVEGDLADTYEEAATATLAALEIEVPEGAQMGLLRSLIAMASKMAAKMSGPPAPEPEADMGGDYDMPEADMAEEPMIAADSRSRRARSPHAVTAGIGRRRSNRQRRTRALDKLTIGG